MTSRRSWSKPRKPRGESYLQLTPRQVIVGAHSGSGMTDSAGSCSHEAFLQGRFHDVVLAEFGASVLAEVLQALGPGLPDFVACTPLMLAARRGDVAGHRFEAIDAADAIGWTALMHAIHAGHDDVAAILLESGASVYPRAFDGATALHLAVMGGNHALTSRLLSRGATTADQMGPPPRHSHGVQHYWAPMRLAATAGDGAMMDLLAAAGAPLHDEDVTLFLHRSISRRTPVAFESAGGSFSYQTCDTDRYAPDTFVIQGSFDLPDLPVCVRARVELDEDGCAVPARGEDAEGLFAFFRASAKPVKAPPSWHRPHWVYLHDWRTWAYSPGLQEVLHRGRTEHLTPLLWLCARAGLDQMVSLLLAAGAQLGEGDLDPVAAAAYYQHAEVLALLGARDAKTLDRALCESADRGDAHSVGRLLALGADPSVAIGRGNALVHSLWRGGDPGVVQHLLEAAADPNSCDEDGCPAVVHAARWGPPSVLRALLDAGARLDAVEPSTGAAPLHAAAIAGALSHVELLLRRGAKVDARAKGRRTALHAVAKDGSESQVAVASALLAAGARLEARDGGGRTPLWYALERGTANALIASLLKQGADAGVTVRGKTLLMVAIEPTGRERHIGRLVRGGADVNARYADNGDTILMRACRADRYLAIEPLIKAGADVHASGPTGDTVLGLARAHCSPHWVQLLEGRAADDPGRAPGGPSVAR